MNFKRDGIFMDVERFHVSGSVKDDFHTILRTNSKNKVNMHIFLELFSKYYY